MQTIVHVYCTSGQSLREKIASDGRLEDHKLQVTKEQKPGRAPGWLKVRRTMSERRGAVNIEWDASTAVLKCRVVNRGSGRPNFIVGDFIEYLLACHRLRLRAVVIVPR